jgi:EAL domain-containing protein (putative c-di-GMP-specific phosphodiesterase class I)
MELYQSKEQGRFQVQFFSAEARERQTVRYSMEKRLFKALERNEFRLYYQPMMDMVTGRTTGAEALIRWIAEDGTLIPPDQFIPLAEENGMIVPIGQWVVKTALNELSVWRGYGLDHLRISINLSARQLQEPDFLLNFLQMLSHSGENPEQVMIEMTETVVMRKAQESIDLLGTLKAHRIKIAIDDFGTGYSSLSYLGRFPVDVLKIDRSFVRQIGEMGEDSEIVRLITLLARALNLEVCAEGVESDLELGYLREFGVGSYQGYLASPAIPSESFVDWVLKSRSRSISS